MRWVRCRLYNVSSHRLCRDRADQVEVKARKRISNSGNNAICGSDRRTSGIGLGTSFTMDNANSTSVCEKREHSEDQEFDASEEHDEDERKYCCVDMSLSRSWSHSLEAKMRWQKMSINGKWRCLRVKQDKQEKVGPQQFSGLRPMDVDLLQGRYTKRKAQRAYVSDIATSKSKSCVLIPLCGSCRVSSAAAAIMSPSL